MLATLLLLAFLLRLLPVFDAELPFSFYGDEINNVERSVNFYVPGQGFDLNPHWFSKPALGYYLNFFFFGLYYLFGHFITGTFSSPQTFACAFLNQDREAFYIIGRLIQVAFGTLTVWLTYCIGCRLLNRKLGQLAALALAIFPAHVAFSHLVKNDVSACFFATLAFWASLRILEGGALRHFVLTGAAIGLGWATKYLPLVLVVVALAASALRREERGVARRRGLVFGGLTLILAAFLGSPWNFLDTTFVQQNMVGMLQRCRAIFFGAGEAGQFSFLYLVRYALFITASPLVASRMVAIPAVLGLVFGWRLLGKSKGLLLFLWLALVYGVILVFSEQRMRPNHLVAAAPALACFFATGVLVLEEQVRKSSSRGAGVVMAGLLLLTLLPWPWSPTWGLVQHYRSVWTPSPRRQALEWVQSHLPAETSLINVAEVLPLIQSAPRQEWMARKITFVMERSRRVVAENERRLEELEGAERKDLERLLDYHRSVLQRWGTQKKKLRMEQKAAPEFDGRRYDALILLKPWQSESTEAAVSAAWGYNALWDRFPLPLVGWDRRRIKALEDIPPVERYRVAASMDSRKLPQYLRILLPVLKGRPMDYLVASQESYDNYVRPDEGDRPAEISRRKRREFPEWAAFYDDLKDHYDYWEFPGDRSIGQWSIRVWKLHPRRPKGLARRLH